MCANTHLGTGWRKPIGCLKLQIIFHKRATGTNYRALLRKITYKDKASYDSTPPYTKIWSCQYSLLHLECQTILISNLNLICLFSREHGKRDLENQIIDWDLRLEKWHSKYNRLYQNKCCLVRRMGHATHDMMNANKHLGMGWLRLVETYNFHEPTNRSHPISTFDPANTIVLNCQYHCQTKYEYATHSKSCSYHNDIVTKFCFFCTTVFIQ